jgi:hypothetical protein
MSYPQATAYCGHAKGQRNAGLGRFHPLSGLNQPDLRADFGLRKQLHDMFVVQADAAAG